MKKFKKYAALFIVGVALCLTGCGENTAKDNAEDTIAEKVDDKEVDNQEADDKADNQEVDDQKVDSQEANDEETDTQEANETVIENDNFKVTVDNDWKKVPVEIMPGSISIAKSNDESINIVKMPEMPEVEGVPIEDYQSSVENNLKAQPGYEIISSEIKDTNLGKVIYIELTTTTTKEMVEQYLEAGIITQESIDALGGIEMYENGMTMNQIVAYYLDGTTVIGFTAQTTNGVNLDNCNAQLDKIMSNMEIK